MIQLNDERSLIHKWVMLLRSSQLIRSVCCGESAECVAKSKKSVKIAVISWTSGHACQENVARVHWAGKTSRYTSKAAELQESSSYCLIRTTRLLWFIHLTIVIDNRARFLLARLLSLIEPYKLVLRKPCPCDFANSNLLSFQLPPFLASQSPRWVMVIMIARGIIVVFTEDKSNHFEKILAKNEHISCYSEKQNRRDRFLTPLHILLLPYRLRYLSRILVRWRITQWIFHRRQITNTNTPSQALEQLKFRPCAGWMTTAPSPCARGRRLLPSAIPGFLRHERNEVDEQKANYLESTESDTKKWGDVRNSGSVLCYALRSLSATWFKTWQMWFQKSTILQGAANELFFEWNPLKTSRENNFAWARGMMNG